MKNDVTVDEQANQQPLAQWIDQLITAKKSKLDFTSEKVQNTDANPGIEIGRFGLKTPDSLRTFLLTPAGETVKHNLSEQIAEQEAIKAEQLMQFHQEAARRARIQAAIFLWLIEKKAHAAHKLRDFIEEQIEQSLKTSEKKPANANKETTPQVNLMDQMSASYQNAIQEYQAEHQKLQKEESALNKKLNKLGEHSSFSKSITEIHSNIEQFEHAELNTLDAKIDALKNTMEQQLEQIDEHINSGEDNKARALLIEHQALHLELAALQDLRSGKEGLKQYLDEQGQEVTSLKDAMYVVKADEKIVIDASGEHYLLDKNQKLDDLSDSEKEVAKERFRTKKPELLTVQKSVRNSMDREEQKNQEQIETTAKALDQNKQQQMDVQNRINFLKSCVAQVNAEIDLPVDGFKTPAPSLSPNALQPTPEVKKFLADKKEAIYTKGKKITPAFLYDLLNTTVSDPKAKATILAFLNSALKLGQIPPMSPLPHTTMLALLQNIPRFGIDAYKPNLSTIPNPSQQQQQQQQRMNPDEDNNIRPSPTSNGR